jgi:hypothetical protein
MTAIVTTVEVDRAAPEVHAYAQETLASGYRAGRVCGAPGTVSRDMP